MNMCTKVIIPIYLPAIDGQTRLHSPRLTILIPKGQRWNFQWLFHPAKGWNPQVAPGNIFLAAAFSGCNSLASKEFCQSSSR
jgi:hypothetical protein